MHPGTDPDPGLECSDAEFNEYYRAGCHGDMEEGLNRAWVCDDGRGIVLGCLSIAAAYLRPDRDPALQGMGYGNIPALLVGYLATDKRRGRQGVAADLLTWALGEAVRTSARVGCRLVMLNPVDDPEIGQFYRNRGLRCLPVRDGEADVFYIDIRGKIAAR